MNINDGKIYFIEVIKHLTIFSTSYDLLILIVSETALQILN